MLSFNKEHKVEKNHNIWFCENYFVVIPNSMKCSFQFLWKNIETLLNITAEWMQCEMQILKGKIKWKYLVAVCICSHIFLSVCSHFFKSHICNNYIIIHQAEMVNFSAANTCIALLCFYRCVNFERVAASLPFGRISAKSKVGLTIVSIFSLQVPGVEYQSQMA